MSCVSFIMLEILNAEQAVKNSERGREEGEETSPCRNIQVLSSKDIWRGRRGFFLLMVQKCNFQPRTQQCILSESAEISLKEKCLISTLRKGISFIIIHEDSKEKKITGNELL